MIPQDLTERCSVALAKDLVHVIATDRQYYAYLSILDQEKFEELKKAGGFKVGIPFAEDIISASADWSDFQQRREKLFRKIAWSANTETLRDELSQVTSPIAYEAWSNCIEVTSRNRFGFYGWIKSEDEEGLTLCVFFNAPPNVKSVHLSGTVTNGSVQGMPAGKIFADAEELGFNETKTIRILRGAAGSTLHVIVFGEGYDSFEARSRWVQLAPSVRCKLHLVFVESKPVFSHTVKATLTTPDHHDDDSDGEPRSSDRKWRAARNELTLRAATGRVLRNPRLTCLGLSPEERELFSKVPILSGAISQIDGACVFSAVDICDIIEQGTRAVAVWRTWSRPTFWQFEADEYMSETSQRYEDNIYPARRGGTVLFLVPEGAAGAIFVADIDSQNTPVEPGKSSTDGAVQCISSVRLPKEGIWYQYRVS